MLVIPAPEAKWHIQVFQIKMQTQILHVRQMSWEMSLNEILGIMHA